MKLEIKVFKTMKFSRILNMTIILFINRMENKFYMHCTLLKYIKWADFHKINKIFQNKFDYFFTHWFSVVIIILNQLIYIQYNYKNIV